MISVCIPTYNGAKYIKAQLDSILYQLGKNDEVIISDDSSTDNTLQVIENLKDSRIFILRHNKFHSPIFNLENALKHAKGDIILLADQDDIWLPEKVTTMMNSLDMYDLVVSDCEIIDEKGKLINESFFQLRNSGKGFWKNVYMNTYLGCCIGFKSELLKYVLPFPKQIPMHDIWLGLLSEIYGKTSFISEKLIQYRRHGENVSYGGANSGFSFLYQLRYRLITLILVFKCIVKNYFSKINSAS